jgi:hypothetical protein
MNDRDELLELLAEAHVFVAHESPLSELHERIYRKLVLNNKIKASTYLEEQFKQAHEYRGKREAENKSKKSLH